MRLSCLRLEVSQAQCTLATITNSPCLCLREAGLLEEALEQLGELAARGLPGGCGDGRGAEQWQLAWQLGEALLASALRDTQRLVQASTIQFQIFCSKCSKY